MSETKPKYKVPQSIVGTSPGRDKGRDFYRTPEYAVEALLNQEKFSHLILEPACGNGAIVEVLENNGYTVFPSDKFDDYGFHHSNFTKHDLMDIEDFYGDVITNPPYYLADRMIEKYMQLQSINKMALLLKLAALEGQKRSEIIEKSHLKKVLVFRKRLTMTRRDNNKSKNNGMIAFAWFIFEKGYDGVPTIGWI